jgi:hypothetical protein
MFYDSNQRFRRVLALVGVLGSALLADAPSTVLASDQAAPLVCTGGPNGQRFHVGVSVPKEVESGAVYTIRIDGEGSGKISHFGLNYLHDLTVEYVLPSGTSYVDGSAEIVPSTGTANVLADARVSYRNGVITMHLPGRVENGSAYTPPSVAFSVRTTGEVGSWAVLGLSRFSLKANAVVVGDVLVSCEPSPRPYPIGKTLIGAAHASTGNQ